ncbi:sugar transferase [Pelagibaca abyssi]|nr:sugar transferase [Salipiger abyssi]
MLGGNAFETARVSFASLSPTGGFVKRAIDIFIVLIAVPAFLPLFIGLVLMIKLTDPGPIFYGHKRIGFSGRTFRCWKFRTMATDGDEILERHFLSRPQDREIWLRERKLDNDPRVTPIGAVLRKLSLDELPQVINVLTGEMSVVGPRPVVADELEIYSRSAEHYLRARPGVTGLWQVSGRSDTSYRERIKLDRYYVSNWHPFLDLWVMLRTVPAVVMARGAR